MADPPPVPDEDAAGACRHIDQDELGVEAVLLVVGARDDESDRLPVRGYLRRREPDELSEVLGLEALFRRVGGDEKGRTERER